jgi:crotonobetainyl-CoA:carnitine CoA-transferase CaiB-like acyl-CoA transferase
MRDQPFGSLAGIRVLEVGSLIAGPFLTRLLADHGAEVIKIEAPDQPDPMRTWGQAHEDGVGLWWAVQSRNKRVVTLDLRHERGQALFRRLVAVSDMVVENFRPGTLERWHLGWEDLSPLNPALVLVRVSGFGQTGPYRDRAGFGSVAEAMGGLRYVNGYPDRPPPRFGISLGDALGSLFGAVGALAALHRSRATGQGQVVDASITEAVMALTESAIPDYARTGVVRERTGSALTGIAPSNVYPTADGQFIVIGANQDRVFQRLAALMDRADLARDPRFQDHVARGRHHAELDAIIAEWTGRLALDDLWDRLNRAGIPAGPIYSVRDVVRDPHFRERGVLTEWEDEEWAPVLMPGVVPQLSETPGAVRWAGRKAVGADNAWVYGEVLGLSPEELEALRSDGVI